MLVADNATLLKVENASGRDREGEPAYAQVWEGEATCYLKRRRRSVLTGGEQVNDRRDILFILDQESAPIPVAGADWEASRVTVTDRRTTSPVTKTFNVTMAEHLASGTTVDYTRMELDSESPV